MVVTRFNVWLCTQALSGKAVRVFLVEVLFMKSRLSRAAAWLPMVFVNPLLAQNATLLNPVVVSATRIEQPLSEVISSVTVISKEDIELSQAVAIEDVLMGQPGIEFSRNGSIGATTSFFLRGQDSKNLVIYVDGVRIQTDGIGSLQTSALPAPQLVERIEILRGNVSALYGEAAIGGVIDIHTRGGGGGDPKFYATTTVGSHNTMDTSAGYGGQVEGVRFNLALSELNTSGIAPFNATQALAMNNSYWGSPYASNQNAGASQVKSFTGAISKDVGQGLELGLREFHSSSRYQYDDGTGPTNLSLNLFSKNDFTTYLNYKITPDWKTHVELTNSAFNSINSQVYDSKAVADQVTYPAGSTSAYSKSTSSTNILKWDNIYSWNKERTLNFGYELTSQNFNSGTDQLLRDSQAFWAGITQRWNSFEFQGNIRHDQLGVNQPDALSSEKYYSVNTGLVGLGYLINNNLKLTASNSTGFRAPAVQELTGYSGGSSTNWNLLPQATKSKELGLEYFNDWSNFRVVRFNTQTTNIIDYDSSYANGAGRFVNDALILNQGWEFSERLNWNGYQVTAAYTLQNPMNAMTGQQLARRARDFGSVDVNKSLGESRKFDVGAKVLFSGSRSDVYCAPAFDSNQTCSLDAYQIWSFYAGMKINEELKLRFRIDNAFNEKYQLAYGYNTPGTTAWLTLIYQEK